MIGELEGIAGEIEQYLAEAQRVTKECLVGSRANNSDLRNSNAQYFKDWAAKNPGYWKKYRNEHPEYEKNNRDQQRLRNERQIAKDETRLPFSLPPGRYQLIPVGPGLIANETVWIVEITILSGP